ncbi:hypothetical protein EJ08DRAFT_665003 [Tothia fuscella]|uniref:BTB domain-containing protein n=1 Tax=Tothia fuscella TaxID=1048955 RepID=A0A9P4NHR6_9PEZI|nr:hypothetical protein EJ08DRAFT_665003 [Tothia fuscella]
MESDSEHMKDLVAGLTEFLASEEHCDLIIACPDGTKLPVHKVIMCARSKFFAKACKKDTFKPCQEANEGIISVQTGSQYTRALVQYCYTTNYNDNDDVFFHAHVYAAADYYQIQTLKNLAKDKFTSAFKPGLSHLAQTIAYIYNSTPDEDSGLRDAVTSLLSKNKVMLFSLFKDPGFLQVMHGSDSLEKIFGGIWDELDILRTTWTSWSQYECLNCKILWAEERTSEGDNCSSCGVKGGSGPF